MKQYNVTEYGVAPNTGEKITEGLQKVLDMCFEQGGGTVVLSEGEYVTGGLRIRSNTTLFLKAGCRLVGTRNPDDYEILKNDTIEPIEKSGWADCRWCNGLIRILHAENVSVIGEPGSVIDGRNCYDPTGEEDYRGPHAISALYCKNLTFAGYKIVDSANWAHSIWYSQNIEGRDLHVFGGHDGFHTRFCQNVTLTDSELYTGDDAIAGYANINVRVAGCTLNTACSAFRFSATNLLCENCRFFGPARYPWRGCLTDEEKINGSNEFTHIPDRLSLLSVYTYFFCEDSSDNCLDPENVTFRNCTVENAERLIQYNFSGGDKWQYNRPLHNITMENIQVKGLMNPIALYGSEKTPLRAVFDHVDIETTANYPHAGLFQTANCRQLSFVDSTLKTASPYLFQSWGNVSGVVFENTQLKWTGKEMTKSESEPYYSLDI